MRFHTVRGGDTIFGIAREYSVCPSKIIEENDADAERLVPGQELMLLRPTRTVTVRGGDTIGGICRRFDVKRHSLILANPRLCLDERIFPGQTLTVKRPFPSLGTATSLGFYRRGCSGESLKRVLPHLTYVVISCAEIKGERVYPFFNDADVLAEVTRRGKISLLGVSDTTCAEFLSDKERSAKIIDGMIALASRGYKGIYLELDEAVEHRDRLCEFLLEVRKRLLGCDLILFTNVGPDFSRDAADLSDGNILFSNGNRTTEERFASESECGKALVMLETAAISDDGRTDIKTALNLAYRAGSIITKNERTCEFRFNKYRMGQKRECRMEFPSLSGIFDEMRECSELGYMGFAFDISTVPTAYLCMISAEFSRADYSLLSSADI